MKQKLRIAIDGPAASGKSSLAKKLAEKKNFYFFNTGILYRSCSYLFHQSCQPLNEQNLEQFLASLQYRIIKDERQIHVTFNEEVLENEQLFSDNNSLITSQISSFPCVRNYLLPIQKEIAQNAAIVMEGRDIASIIMPDADYKFFITASSEERARRRLLQEKINTSLETQEGKHLLKQRIKEIKERDQLDKTRPIAPLVASQESILINTTNLSLEESLNEILTYLKN